MPSDRARLLSAEQALYWQKTGCTGSWLALLSTIQFSSSTPSSPLEYETENCNQAFINAREWRISSGLPLRRKLFSGLLTQSTIWDHDWHLSGLSQLIAACYYNLLRLQLPNSPLSWTRLGPPPYEPVQEAELKVTPEDSFQSHWQEWVGEKHVVMISIIGTWKTLGMFEMSA